MKKTSKYKGVGYYEHNRGGRIIGRWQAACWIKDKRWNSYHETERDAAIAYDKKMIELGREPVNFLKPKL